MNLQDLNIEQLRELAAQHELKTAGNAAQLRSRLEKHLEAAAAPAAPTATPEVDAVVALESSPTPAPAPAPVETAAPKKKGKRIRYTPRSKQHLSLATLYVPGQGVVFDEPQPEYESFVPYFLTRTEE